MKAYSFSTSGALCSCLLKAIEQGVADSAFSVWSAGDKAVVVSAAPALDTFLNDHGKEFGVEALLPKALKTDYRFTGYEEHRYPGLHAAFGTLLSAQLTPADEPRPSAVIVEVASFPEFQALVTEALALDENEMFYAPESSGGRLFLKILSPPYFLLVKWLRRGLSLYTPSRLPGLFTPWGLDIGFSVAGGFTTGVLLRKDGTFCTLAEEMQDLREILQVDRSALKELPVRFVDFPAFQIPLTLQRAENSADPSLWITSDAAQVERLLGQFPEAHLANTRIGAFQDGTPHPIYVVLLDMPMTARLSALATRALGRTCQAYYPYRLESFYLPAGYEIKPFVSRESIARAFWGDASPDSTLVLVAPETPIRYRRFPVSRLLSGPQAFRYFVEKKEEELKPVLQKVAGQGDNLWKAFVEETQRPGWFAALLGRLRGKK